MIMKKSRRKISQRTPPNPGTESPDSYSVSEVVTMRELQDGYINWVLSKCVTNSIIEEAASKLRISPRTIYNRIYSEKVKIPNS